jgi:hypothetical protein
MLKNNINQNYFVICSDTGARLVMGASLLERFDTMLENQGIFTHVKHLKKYSPTEINASVFTCQTS